MHNTIKFFSLLLILLFMTFISCSCAKNNVKGASASEGYVFGQDDQYWFNKFSASDLAVAESEDGYYFFSGPGQSYLYFLDKKTMKAQILCDKPDCLHADEPDPSKKTYCNAFFNITFDNLIYYNKYLYILDAFSGNNSGYGLYQVSLDGTQRKQIYTFKTPISNLIIHRGYIYYSVAEISFAPQEENLKPTTAEIYRLDISDLGKKPELLYQTEGYNAYINRVIGYENNIYFLSISYTDDMLQKPVLSLMKYGITDGHIDVVQPNVGFYSICDNHIVYYSYLDKKVYQCNLDGSNTILLDQIKGAPFCSDQYIFVDSVQNKIVDNGNKRELTVYDIHGNQLSTIDINNFSNKDMIYGCDGSIIFIPDNYSEKNEFGNIESLWTIDLSTIDKGAPDMKQVFKFVPKVKDTGVQTNAN